MNASEIISKSMLNQTNLKDSDKSFDGSKTFGDYKGAIVQVIEKIDAMLPKMKAAGTDMKKAAGEVDGLFRNMLRRVWGGSDVSFYTARDGNKVIVSVTSRNIDDITKQVSDFVANY